RTAYRTAAGLSGAERARPTGAVRLCSPCALRGADRRGPEPDASTGPAGFGRRSCRRTAGNCRAAACGTGRSRLDAARRGLDVECDAAPARLELGAADRRTAGAAGA